MGVLGALGEVHVSLEDNQLAPIAVTGATHTDGTTAELRCLSTEGGKFADVTMARLITTRVGSVDETDSWAGRRWTPGPR